MSGFADTCSAHCLDCITCSTSTQVGWRMLAQFVIEAGKIEKEANSVRVSRGG